MSETRKRAPAIGLERFVKTWIRIVGEGGSADDVAAEFNERDGWERTAQSMSTRASQIRAGIKADNGDTIKIPLPKLPVGGGGGRKHANADMLHSLRALCDEHGVDPDEYIDEPLAEATPDEVVVG